MRATRAEVYDAIDGERDYQDAGMGNAETDVAEFSIGDSIVFMEEYLGKARAALSGKWPQGRADAVDAIRKVAALAVRTMEQHGAPKRKV